MAIIYVDESGDLGWTFTAPYRAGGSSRYLTISALLVENAQKHHPKRVIRALYERMGVKPATEIKWVDIKEGDRVWIAGEIYKLKRKLGDEMKLFSMTVNKQNVMPHIRSDSNKLYNYMLNLLLCKEMAKHGLIHLIPDQRSVKVASGNSMHDYLQTQLWFEQECQTTLTTNPMDSKSCLGLQFADIIAGMVQSSFEDGNRAYIDALNNSVQIKRLYF